MRHKRVYAALLAFVLPLQAHAVSCGGYPSIDAAFERADYVFSAYVESHFTAPAFKREDVTLARLRVLQVWKGDLQLGQVVTASAEDSVFFVSDGFVPLLESAVLVYTGGPEPFALSVCSRNSTLDAATGDIPRLNRLSKKKAYRGH